MPEDKSNQIAQTDQLETNVWVRRTLKLPEIEQVAHRRVTEQDIHYLRRSHPFLQLVNSSASEDCVAEPKAVVVRTGWQVLDYQIALSSSASSFSESEDRPQAQDEKEGEEGTEAKPPFIGPDNKGTIVKQAFDTAQEMVKMASEKGWEVLRIVDGSDLMRWAAWVASHSYAFEIVEGFEPTKEEKEKYKRLRKLRKKGDLSFIAPEDGVRLKF